MKPISTSKNQSVNLLLIAFSAISLALGVALIANYLTEIIGATKILLGIGFILIVVSIYLISKLLNPKVKQVLRIRGAYFFNPSSLKGKEIIGYEFNEDIATYLRSIALENKAYSRSLAKGYEDYDSVFTPFNPDSLDYYNLVASCTEFLFLRKLSYHLNSFFINEEIDKSKIHEMPRREMDSNVLRNRVLELITRNHQEREAFCDNHEEDGETILCYDIGENGEVFDHLVLEFPINSTLVRMPNNTLKIENDIFEMHFNVQCDATNTIVEPELIVGGYSAPWLVSVKIEVTIKKRLFITTDEIELHKWLDSFLSNFEDYLSIKKLHDRSPIQLLRMLKP